MDSFHLTVSTRTPMGAQPFDEGKEMLIKERIDSLKTAILNSRPPYCGTMALKPEDLVLFYGRENRESLGRLDFTKANDDALEHLSNTCDRATFGLNQEDVLDESYRKAGELDAASFATKIDLERSGLTDIVRFDLLQGENSGRPIHAELYKLNVYGKDSFFKAHKDTPRGTAMFGSLVIVLPTVHEGGALILRHNGREWTFDSAKEISQSHDPKTHIGYVSFFSDVEHEVTPVKAGYRVTLTYNLYYSDTGDDIPKTLEVTKALPLNEGDIKNALQVLLDDENFYPDGVHLGFGLNHENPIEVKPKNVGALDFISRHLKGSDALLMEVCKELKLDARLFLVYQLDNNYDLIIPETVKLEEKDLFNIEERVWRHLQESWQYRSCVSRRSRELEDEGAHATVEEIQRRYDAKVIGIVHPENRPRINYNEENSIDFRVKWVTDRTKFNMQKIMYGAYGNEPSIEHVYGCFCLVVRLGPAGYRATAQ